MDRDLVIGIDCSTSSAKAIAWNAHGHAVAEGRAPIALSNPEPGFFEQDPHDWWLATCSALKQVTIAVDPQQIASVGISNQRETFALVTANGRALRPGTTWLDQRAFSQVRDFGEEFGADRLHAISGKPLDVTPCLFRFLWHAEHEPDLFRQSEMFADVNAFITFHLTGEWATPVASADPLGMVDMAQMTWSDEILGAAGIDLRRLPRLVRSGKVLGELTRQAADATGLPAGTPVIAAGGDGQCAGTGAGLLASGGAYINLGTAVVSGIYGKHYAHDPAFRTEIAVADDGYIFETCLRSGTFLIDWFARAVLGVEPSRQRALVEQLEREAAQVPIGAGGMVVVPYWQGCMTPYWDSSARGIIAGLSGSSHRGHVYRAILEGIALECCNTSDRVTAATGVPIDTFIAVGGGAVSDLWAQLLADASGRAVIRSSTVEASSLGAAMAAARGAGWFPSIAAASAAMAGKPVASYTPDPQRRARYAELRSIFVDLWPAVAEWNRRLTAFSEHVAV